MIDFKCVPLLQHRVTKSWNEEFHRTRWPVGRSVGDCSGYWGRKTHLHVSMVVLPRAGLWVFLRVKEARWTSSASKDFFFLCSRGRCDASSSFLDWIMGCSYNKRLHPGIWSQISYLLPPLSSFWSGHSVTAADPKLEQDVHVIHWGWCLLRVTHCYKFHAYHNPMWWV